MVKGRLNSHAAQRLFASLKAQTMAWRSHGSSNESLVANLKRNGMFSDERVRAAMLKVDRADFCSVNPYMDSPESIGYNATISAPHMHASALERLKDHLTEGDRALDVGSGSGYLTACMAIMVGEQGRVVGIEHIGELVDLSVKNINKNHPDLISSGRVKMVEGDGRLGYAPDGPYKAIHVGAAAPTLPPELVDQLAPGGRMLIPIGGVGSDQKFVQVDKDAATGEVHCRNLMGVIYVPLTNKEFQMGRSRY